VDNSSAGIKVVSGTGCFRHCTQCYQLHTLEQRL
jgi:hypothetical protein